ncbi:MAG: hypothetical protein AAB602_01730 [Patescibacteria group bacterium]
MIPRDAITLPINLDTFCFVEREKVGGTIQKNRCGFSIKNFILGNTSVIVMLYHFKLSQKNSKSESRLSATLLLRT